MYVVKVVIDIDKSKKVAKERAYASPINDNLKEPMDVAMALVSRYNGSYPDGVMTMVSTAACRCKS